MIGVVDVVETYTLAERGRHKRVTWHESHDLFFSFFVWPRRWPSGISPGVWLTGLYNIHWQAGFSPGLYVSPRAQPPLGPSPPPGPQSTSFTSVIKPKIRFWLAGFLQLISESSGNWRFLSFITVTDGWRPQVLTVWFTDSPRDVF